MTRSRDYAPQAPSIGRFKIVGPNPIGLKAPSYLVLDTNVVIAIGRLAFKGPSASTQDLKDLLLAIAPTELIMIAPSPAATLRSSIGWSPK